MGIKDFDKFSKSQRQLKNFIDNCEGLPSRATVVVKRGDEIIYQDECDVYEGIETNYSRVDIIGTEDKGSGTFLFYMNYRNDYQEFYCHGRTLSILANDREGKRVEIEVTR